MKLLIAITLAARAFAQVPNPDITQENLHATICRPKFTKSIRPPAKFTNALKQQQMAELGLSGNPDDYEEDHVWPLEAGGHPKDPRNLVPQPWPEARKKDQVENFIHRELCAGHILLSDVPDMIEHWQDIYPTLKRRKTQQ